MKFVFLFLFLFPIFSHAFRLSPMVAEFAPSGNKATQTFLLENPGKEKVALQLEVAYRKVDVNGKEDYTQVSPDFVIYPEQLSLSPGEKRNVRVTWVGNSSPEMELPFRLVASQLPVTLQRPSNRGDVKVNLKFILQYVASIYVMPEGVKSRLVVKEIKHLGGNKIEILATNEGTSRQFLEKAKIKIKSAGKEVFLDDKQMEKIRSENILAKASRKFQLHLPIEYSKDTQVAFELE